MKACYNLGFLAGLKELLDNVAPAEMTSRCLLLSGARPPFCDHFSTSALLCSKRVPSDESQTFILRVTTLVRFFWRCANQNLQSINDHVVVSLHLELEDDRFIVWSCDVHLRFNTHLPPASFSLDIVFGFRNFGRARIKLQIQCWDLVTSESRKVTALLLTRLSLLVFVMVTVTL